MFDCIDSSWILLLSFSLIVIINFGITIYLIVDLYHLTKKINGVCKKLDMQ
jgi:hypothetical protein